MVQALDFVTAPSDVPLPPVGPARSSAIRHLQALGIDRNVVGVGISEKTTDGETTGELSVCFYVKEKKSRSRTRGDKLIPSFVSLSETRTFLTDVKEIGPLRLHHAEVGGLRSGASVSHALSAAGTIGAIVTRGGKPCILSNAHVLARAGKAKVGDPVLSPGTTDGGKLATDLVAKLLAFSPINGFGSNVVDAAIAEILPSQLGRVDPAILGATLPRRTGKVLRGMAVVKTGKTTHTTTGHVMDEHFRPLLPFPGMGLVRFVDQILCTAFAEPGDSGALVMDEATGLVVGLQFSGNSQVSVCNPIGPVLAALAISL